MKRWKRGFSGIGILILVVILSITVSVDIKVHGKEQVISNIAPFQKEIVKGDKVREITDSEYNKLTLGEVSANSLKSADINSKVTLKGLTNKSYKFKSSESAVLLPLSPLRTVRESFPSYGSSIL